ncbi:hypothetical protein L596_029723 [Steinernema carpocapsae]|uniref:Uncharacterized protein n=1 Tax=Steinernema carpocapsae TaxID=34508 RepID=A0A4U5LQM6_STECR|nr:hypothetical protein L596_029723 [Steinernema carpocapsae]
MSEWLRRLTRNQLGSARVGSNPARCEQFLFAAKYLFFRFSAFQGQLVMNDLKAEACSSYVLALSTFALATYHLRRSECGVTFLGIAPGDR